MKQKNTDNSSKPQSQVTKLETQLSSVKDEKLKAEIQKKIDILKTGKTVTK